MPWLESCSLKISLISHENVFPAVPLIFALVSLCGHGYLGGHGVILILVGASQRSPNKMGISNAAHKNVCESNVRKWEASRLRMAESSGNGKKTASTSLSVLFVIIWAPVGVKTSVLVWQGLGSAVCAKGKNWHGLKAAQ